MVDLTGYISVNEFIRRSGRSIATVYRHLNIGKLKAEKVGTNWFIPESELGKYPPKY